MREEITVKATIAAPIALVWEAFVRPKHITEWNFAHESWYCPSADVDLRVGGVYRARMEAKDGSAGFDFEGIYDEVDPMSAVAMTLGDGRKTRTNFVQSDEGVEVTTIFEAESENSPSRQGEGWQAILDSFKFYVENRALPDA